MEDYNSNLLNDSKNEWSILLMNKISGHIIDGFRAIFNEALTACEENDEPQKYLMTFQNYISRIPSWNETTIQNEVNRIKENSGCDYLEDLITCIHIIQLKILSCSRTSNYNKKIDIDIPNLNSFIHSVYINIARKLYLNSYLFQIDVSPLEQQKNNREFEVIVQSCIMNTVRDSIPVEELLKQYIGESEVENQILTEKILKNTEQPEKAEENNAVVSEKSKAENNVNSNNITQEQSITSIVESLKQKPEIEDKIHFNQKVEKHNPIAKETSIEEINFDPKPEPASLFDDDDQDFTPLKFADDKKETPKFEFDDISSITEKPKEPEKPKDFLFDSGLSEIKL